MRTAIGLFGLVAGLIVVLLVGRYGLITSDTAVDGIITAFFFGVIAIGGIAGPAAAIHLWGVDRCWGVIAGLVAVAALLANLSNSLGAIAGRSDRTVAERAQAKEGREDAKAELGRIGAALAAVPAHTPTSAEAVEAARGVSLAATRTREAECGKRGPNCRQRETEEATAQGALALAVSHKAATDRAAKLEGDAAAIRKKMEKAPAVASVNPLADTLGRLLSIEAATAATAQQIATVAVVELLIALALLAWELLGKGAELRELEVVVGEDLPKREIRALPVPRCEVGDVAKWAVDALEPQEAGATRIASLYGSYAVWCVSRGEMAVDHSLFGDFFRKLCGLSGFAVRRGCLLGLAPSGSCRITGTQRGQE